MLLGLHLNLHMLLTGLHLPMCTSWGERASDRASSTSSHTCRPTLPSATSESPASHAGFALTSASAPAAAGEPTLLRGPIVCGASSCWREE